MKTSKTYILRSFDKTGVALEYVSLAEIPHYSDCEPIVFGLGYSLVELRIFRTNGTTQIRAVIAHADSENPRGIGIDDCAKVHRLLLPRLEAILKEQDIYMEVTSPGTERLIKNAAEFAFFVKKYMRVYDTTVSDWITGQLIRADKEQIVLLIDGTEKIIPLDNIAKAKLLNS